MPPVYIVRQLSKIRINNRRLQVENEHTGTGKTEVFLSVPLAHVSQLVLFGNVGLTTPAISALLAQNIEVVFLKLDGEYRGSLTGELTPHVPLRRMQYRRLSDPSFVLEMAKCFVTAKLLHQRVLLQRQQRMRPHELLQDCIQKLAAAISQVPRKTTLSSLRGVEGSATAVYFSGFRSLFDPRWKFNSRQRRPPPDAVNVLLSFGYTLLAQIASGAIRTTGLDPYAGFLHEVAYNRPALALDLLEEFRPLVDGVVLWCCSGGQITPQDFENGAMAERPVVLLDEGKRRFIRAFENRLDQPCTHPRRGLKFPMRQCIIEQAREIARCIMEGAYDYQPMGFR